MGDSPALSMWECNWNGPYKWKGGKSDFMWEELDLLLLGRWRKELQTKGCGWPLKAGKGKKTASPQSFQKERDLKSLGFSPNETHCGFLTFRTVGTINLNGLKPLSLWYFVTVATGNEYRDHLLLQMGKPKPRQVNKSFPWGHTAKEQQSRHSQLVYGSRLSRFCSTMHFLLGTVTRPLALTWGEVHLPSSISADVLTQSLVTVAGWLDMGARRSIWEQRQHLLYQQDIWERSSILPGGHGEVMVN